MEPPPLHVPPASARPDSLITRIAKAVVRKIFSFVVVVGVILLIGYCTTDHKDYPGKKEFEVADNLITTKTGGTAFGNSDKAKQVAAKFSSSIKSLQSVFFKGGSGFSVASGGEFLTYCHHNPDSVVFLVHVPELRNYKDPKTRETLGSLAWTMANASAKELSFGAEAPTIIVGLRGFGSYGPIWSGKLGKDAEVKTDDLDEKRRLYPFFLPRNSSK